MATASEITLDDILNLVVLGLVTRSEVSEDGSTYTFRYDIGNLYSMIKAGLSFTEYNGLLDEILAMFVGVDASQVGGFVADHNITGELTFTFTDNSAEIGFTADIKNTGAFRLNADAFVLDNALYTQEEVEAIRAAFPEGRAEAPVFNAINMKLGGTFDFVDVTTAGVDTVVSYRWQLIVDADVLEIIRAVKDVKETSDPYGWAKHIQNSKFHLMVWHEHSADCTTYCDDRNMEGSSLFDIAFDPAAFGTSNLYVGLDITKFLSRSVMNKVMEIVGGLMGEGGAIDQNAVDEMLQGLSEMPYLVLNLDLDALARFGAMTDFVVPTVSENALATAGTDDLLAMLPQILDIVKKTFSFHDGLTVNLEPVVDFALGYLEDILASTGLDITTADIKEILGAMIGGSEDPANGFRVRADANALIYSDRVSSYDSKQMLGIDPATGSPRNYNGQLPVVSYTNPYKDMGLAMVGSTLLGANQAVTVEQLQALVGQSMAVTAVYLDGSVSSTNDPLAAVVSGIQGIDLTNYETAQTVNFIVYPMDNAGLIAMVGQLIPALLGKPLPLPGAVIPVEIKLKKVIAYDYSAGTILGIFSDTSDPRVSMDSVDKTAANCGMPETMELIEGEEAVFVIVGVPTYSDKPDAAPDFDNDMQFFALTPSADGFQVVENVGDMGYNGFRGTAGADGWLEYDDGLGVSFRIHVTVTAAPPAPEKVLTGVTFADEGQTFQLKLMENALGNDGSLLIGSAKATLTYDDGTSEEIALTAENVELPAAALDGNKLVAAGEYEYTLRYGDFTAQARFVVGTDNVSTSNYDFQITPDEANGSYKISFSASRLGNKSESVTAEFTYAVEGRTGAQYALGEQAQVTIADSLHPEATEFTIGAFGVLKTADNFNLTGDRKVKVTAVINGETIVREFTHRFKTDVWSLSVSNNESGYFNATIRRANKGEVAPSRWNWLTAHGISLQLEVYDQTGVRMYDGYTFSDTLHKDYVAGSPVTFSGNLSFAAAGTYTVKYSFWDYEQRYGGEYLELEGGTFTVTTQGADVPSASYSGGYYYVRTLGNIEGFTLLTGYNGSYGTPYEGAFDVYLVKQGGGVGVYDWSKLSVGDTYNAYVYGLRFAVDSVPAAEDLALLITVNGHQLLLSQFTEKRSTTGKMLQCGWDFVDKTEAVTLTIDEEEYLTAVTDESGQAVTAFTDVRYGDIVKFKVTIDEDSYVVAPDGMKLYYLGQVYSADENGYFNVPVIVGGRLRISGVSYRYVKLTFVDKTTGVAPDRVSDGYTAIEKNVVRMKDDFNAASAPRIYDKLKVGSFKFYLKNADGTYAEIADGKLLAAQLTDDMTVYVEAIPPAATAIEIPAGTVFEDVAHHGALDLTGKTIKVTYDNGATENVALTAEMLSEGYSAELGEQTVTVTYEGKTCTFTVNVVAADTPPVQA